MNKPAPAETIDLGNGTLARIDPTTNEIIGFTNSESKRIVRINNPITQ